MSGKAGRKIGPALRVRPEGESLLLDGQLTLTRDKSGLALAKDLVSALTSITTSLTAASVEHQATTIDISAFVPFADDTAALNLSGVTVENHPARINLWGQTPLARSDKITSEGAALLALSKRVLEALETIDLPDTQDGEPDGTTMVQNPFL
jgi:hypothetical protein